jgi:sugar phosphate permease
MFIAVMINATKFFLFSFLETPWIILAVTVMTGFSFVGIQFCTVNFLNDHMPRKMRSTAQAFSGLVAQVMGAIIVGSMGGWLADTYSVPVMLRGGAFVVAAGGVAFYILFGKAMKYHNKHYGPNMVPLGSDGQPLYVMDEMGNIIEEIKEATKETTNEETKKIEEAEETEKLC